MQCIFSYSTSKLKKIFILPTPTHPPHDIWIMTCKSYQGHIHPCQVSWSISYCKRFFIKLPVTSSVRNLSHDIRILSVIYTPAKFHGQFPTVKGFLNSPMTSSVRNLDHDILIPFSSHTHLPSVMAKLPWEVGFLQWLVCAMSIFLKIWLLCTT